MRVFRPWFAIFCFCAMLACAEGCVRPKAVPKPKPEVVKPLAVGKHILLIVPQSNFSDQNYDQLLAVFTAQGAETQLAAPRATTASSIKGSILPTDLSLELVDVNTYDALVFVGGKGAASLFQNKDALRLAREAAEHNKVLGASDAATLILGLAGVLEGKTATAPPRLAKSFTDVSKCTYSDTPVEADGLIVTSASPAESEHFARKIVELLQ